MVMGDRAACTFDFRLFYTKASARVLNIFLMKHKMIICMIAEPYMSSIHEVHLIEQAIMRYSPPPSQQ